MNKRQILREWVRNNIPLIENTYSKEEIQKIVDSGMATAKAVFKDKFDPSKAKKVILAIIDKGISKNMEPKEISGWVQNAVRDENYA